MTENSDWHDDIWNRHAGFFDRSAPFASGIWSLPDGWRETVETMLDRIAADDHRPVRFESIRRHQGEMTVAYSDAGPAPDPLVADAIARASARASCTCEVCGKAGSRQRTGDETVVRCDVHALRGSRTVWPPWHLLRIEREIAGGVSRIVRCHIYDRDHDSFVGIDPATLGIPGSP